MGGSESRQIDGPTVQVGLHTVREVSVAPLMVAVRNRKAEAICGGFINRSVGLFCLFVVRRWTDYCGNVILQEREKNG